MYVFYFSTEISLIVVQINNINFHNFVLMVRKMKLMSIKYVSYTLGTFDVQNVSVSIVHMLAVSQLCLMVEYIEGNGTPPYTFVMLVCPAIEYVQ